MPWEITYEMHFGGVKLWDHGRKDLVTSMMPGDTGLMMDLDFLNSFRQLYMQFDFEPKISNVSILNIDRFCTVVG